MSFKTTEVCQVNPLQPQADAIARAATWINMGKVVAFPTETVYGLGADATSDSAVKEIYKAKNRPSDNPLISHFASVEDIVPYVRDIPEIAYQMAEMFWPGPLTMVLKRSDKISSLVTKGLDTVAVRIPAHPVAIALIETAGVPIAAPSANLSGRPSPTQASHVYHDLRGIIPMILDGGSTSIGIESTVINLVSDQPVILRPGGVTLEELQKILPEIAAPRINSVDQPLSPGMKYTHYSPDTEVILLENGYHKLESEIEQISKELSGRTLIMCTNPLHHHIRDHIRVGTTLKEVQLNLFASLRLLDDDNYDYGIFEGVSSKNEGYAIMNRITKAAHRVI